ncbi:hypothetical protein D9611_000058 [Ephemerocybe angulata]|uniref:BSD domain-containing protein n=1 Tax=Ephemerocybe angulata TaxID=980116 RepID=A0A8H5F6S1_9AGAR|nr:hypothetical protein D9611_000058 [Tulosesus angulatus]
MNFFDNYEVGRAPTPLPNDNASQENQPSLNEEVNQLVGQLGRFWGGFKKQSQQVLEVAKKDLGDVVLQAQKEIEKLTTVEDSQPEASTSTVPGTEDGQDPARSAPSPGSASDGAPSTAEGETPASGSTADQPAARPSHARSASQSLFARLQSAVPPNLISTVQSHIPESIKHASETIDLSQMSSNLMTELHRVQGVTRAQAEEYAKKSEALIREAMKEANELVKDAVKIIPPDPVEGAGADAAGAAGPGMIWDGSDMWMLPVPTAEAAGGNGKERAGSADAGKQGESETRNAVATRALALLHRLQRDPSIVQRDPAADEGMKEVYEKWVGEEIKAKGGIESPEWAERTARLLMEEMTLYEIYTSLVPATLSKEDFWSRYFFREHQIKHEEERRKALIQATVTESDEDFSWEDDEDDNAVSSTAAAATAAAAVGATAAVALSKGKSIAEPSATAAPALQSPSASEGSADSFDLLSSTNASVAGDVNKAAGTPKAEADDDEEEDDDDEDDDEDDDDDDEEGEEEGSDSDWE